ncbi:MAG: OmpH family outer membrane protein [Gammaproteobacteria bacterium]|nr:OmpH family outer membrane protein [Gammaproteobacteria bacterium]
MKHLILSTLFVFNLVLVFSPASFAQTGLYKIGFVNTGTVLKEAPQARKVEEKLKSEFEAREKILRAKQRELLAIENQIKTEGERLSQSAQRKLERELRLKLSQLKFEQQEFREDQNLRRNEEIRNLQTVIAAVLKRLGDEEKFDLILTEGVSYVSDVIDITPKLIDMLKQLSEQESATN